MNTTMADGARERCVAQIGEALFGQPGLTLMELAEKVKESGRGHGNTRALAEHITDHLCEHEYDIGGRPELLACVVQAIESDARTRFEAWARANGHTLTRAADGEYCFISVRDLWNAWQTDTAAQPSPAGQGDALLEQVARFLDYSVGHDPWPNIRRVYGDAWWEPVRKMRDDLRALAARQPVEFERAIPTRRRESAVELLLQLGFVWNNQHWEDRRQPVGQEPVGDECEGCKGGIRYNEKGCTCTTCGKRPKWYMGGRRIRITERRKPWKHFGTPVPFEAECTWHMGDSIDYRLDGETTTRRLNNYHQHWEKVEVIR
ncbi:hypothetical protein [Stenotrophomonas sp.]|uniref:hypothetical protein n=1 Tax=Stenotrophomonas sp. TaxID=69392 RepID=UPI0028964F10|nr:hypothetical protein [Stenotrophomonas sp.]